MESLKTALKQFVSHVSKTASIYILVILIFSYHVLFDKDFSCTCKDKPEACGFYLILPGVLIIIFLLWTNRDFQRALKYTCGYRKSHFHSVLIYHLVRAILIGLLWTSSVLIDGDWFVCCRNDHSEQQRQLACKDKKDLTAEEREVIAGLKNESMLWGLSVLLAITLFASCMSPIPRERCCSCVRSNCRSKRTTEFDEIILEEAENLVTKKLREAAQEELAKKLKNHVDEKQWMKCFDVDKDFISEVNDPPSPSGSQEGSPSPSVQQQGDPPSSSVQQQGDPPSPSVQQQGDPPSPSVQQQGDPPSPSVQQQGDPPSPSVQQQGDPPSPSVQQAEDLVPLLSLSSSSVQHVGPSSS